MEDFKEKALRTAQNPPRLLMRFVSDMFVVQFTEHKDFLQHINNIDSAITFIIEDMWSDGSKTFLDMLNTPEYSGALTTSIHKNPIHMDQYLCGDTHYHIGARYSVINTLTQGAKTVLSLPELLITEKQHIGKGSSSSTANTYHRP